MQKDVASIALFIRKSNCKIDAKTAWREAAALVHYSAKYGVPVALTTAVAQAESTFNPNAVSSKGASGVMQVMWKIHNGLLRSNGIQATPGVNPLADPEHAIAAGCLLLSRYIRVYGSVHKAMDRYYGGPSAGYQRKINGNIAKLMRHQSKLFD
jgi:soluble lytic murein transglycosylase-like protein